MADLAKIVDDLSALTVLEASELSKMLEEKWGVSAAAPVAAAAGPAAAAAAPVEEKTEFKRGIARWRTLHNRPQRGFCLRVAATGDIGTRNQCGNDRILCVEFLEKTSNLVVAAFDQRARRLLDRGWLSAARLRHGHRNDREDG